MHRIASFVAIAVLIAACGGSDEAAPEYAFVYGYGAGDRLVYDVTLEQRLSSVIDIQSLPALFGGTDLPESADVVVRSNGRLVYDIAAGPDPGTLAITATTTFTETEITGDIDGEPIESPDDVPNDLTPNLEPGAVTFVIDTGGAVLSSTRDETNPFALLENPIAIGTSVGFDPLSSHLGPQFSTDTIVEGDSWTTVSSASLFSATIETTTTHTLAALEADNASISTTYTNNGFQLALGDLLRLIFGGAADLTDDAQSEAPASTVDGSGFDLTISGSPLVGRGNSVFDRQAGVVTSYDTFTTIPATMSTTFPDDTTGELIDGSIDLVLEVSLVATLTDDQS